jgi:hypothetical protein
MRGEEFERGVIRQKPVAGKKLFETLKLDFLLRR